MAPPTLTTYPLTPNPPSLIQHTYVRIQSQLHHNPQSHQLTNHQHPYSSLRTDPVSIYHQPTCTSNHSQHPLSSVLFPFLYPPPHPHFINNCSTFLPSNLLYERWASLLLLISQNCDYSLTTMQQLHSLTATHPARSVSYPYKQTNKPRETGKE